MRCRTTKSWPYKGEMRIENTNRSTIISKRVHFKRIHVFLFFLIYVKVAYKKSLKKDNQIELISSQCKLVILIAKSTPAILSSGRSGY